MIWYSGCNYYINQGKNDYESLGTATSMHDCVNCEELDKCPLKKEEETWEYSLDHEQKAKLFIRR